MKSIIFWWLVVTVVLAGPALAKPHHDHNHEEWDIFVATSGVLLWEEHALAPKLALDVGVARVWHRGKRLFVLGLAVGFDSHLHFGPIIVVGDLFFKVGKGVSIGPSSLVYIDFSGHGWEAVGVGFGPKVMVKLDRGVHAGLAVDAIGQVQPLHSGGAGLVWGGLATVEVAYEVDGLARLFRGH